MSTLPPQTLRAFREHGEVRGDLSQSTAQADAARVRSALSAAGIDLNAVAAQLERDGVKLFADAFDSLLQTISRKSAAA